MPSRISVTQGPQGAKGFRFAALISMQLFGTDWETLALGRVCYSYRRQRGSVERALRTRGTYGRPTASRQESTRLVQTLRPCRRRGEFRRSSVKSGDANRMSASCSAVRVGTSFARQPESCKVTASRRESTSAFIFFSMALFQCICTA